MGINNHVYIMMFFMLIAAVDRDLSQFGGSAHFLGKLGKALRDPAVSLKKGLWRWARWARRDGQDHCPGASAGCLLGPVIIPLYEMLGIAVDVRRHALLAAAT